MVKTPYQAEPSPPSINAASEGAIWLCTAERSTAEASCRSLLDFPTTTKDTLGQETDRDFIAELAKVFYCKADIVTGQTHRHPHCQTPLQRHAFALALPG